jgi:hypothetical protein
MTEAEWLACIDPIPMLEFIKGKVSDRKLRLFAVACCRRVWHLLVDERSREAVAVAERFADGVATEQELEGVRQVAWEFSLHTVHENEAFFDLGADALNAADVPAWTAEWSVEPVRVVIAAQRALGSTEQAEHSRLLRCVVNPFRSAPIHPIGGRGTKLAEGIYAERAFDRLPRLADALEEAGCTDAEILDHCRVQTSHVRGCWVIDLLLGKM